jgi:hypothetical protein
VAGQINATAGEIVVPAQGILDRAKLIDRDTAAINRTLDVTIRIAGDIEGDTEDILEQALRAHDTAACIDRNVGGEQSDDGDCEGRED